MAIPSDQLQLTFLNKLQRLFAEGEFTATYKFALLIALCDLAIESEADADSEVLLKAPQIAERFIGLYWPHVTPYGAGRVGTQPGVLSQNLGAQAAIVNAIAEFRRRAPSASLSQATALPAYALLVSDVARTVSAQPLTYLQNFGGGTDEFIYDRPARGVVRLKPGVAYCLKRFHSLIQQIARTQWVAHVKGNQRNRSILGESDDLEEFLFSTPRQSLAKIGDGLLRLEGPACFYCGGTVASDADVDHFIPRALYSRDIAHNFVRSHDKCNRSKSDTLAALPHLEKWLTRLERRGDDIADIASNAGFVVSLPCALQVARWSYDNARDSGAHAWLRPGCYDLVDDSYSACFG